MKLIVNKVGIGCKNSPSDVKTVIDLLSKRQSQFKYKQCLSKMIVPKFGEDQYIDKLIDAIKIFQKSFQNQVKPSWSIYMTKTYTHSMGLGWNTSSTAPPVIDFTQLLYGHHYTTYSESIRFTEVVPITLKWIMQCFLRLMEKPFTSLTLSD